MTFYVKEAFHILSLALLILVDVDLVTARSTQCKLVDCTVGLLMQVSRARAATGGRGHSYGLTTLKNEASR